MSRLVKYLGVILKWRRLIFWNTLIFTALAIVASFILPPRYTAVAQLLPPSDEGDMFGLTSLLSGGAGGGLSKLRSSMLGGSAASDIMVGILDSRTVVMKVAERCSVARYYRIRPKNVDQTVKQLRDMTKIGSGDEGIVRISVEAKTRQLAANIANAYVAELDSFLRTSNISRGRNMRLFVERRLGQVDSSMAAARESLQAFQQQHKVVAVDEETKAAIDAYAQMKSRLTLKEAELEAARSAANDDNPYVVNLDREVVGLRGELGKLERGSVSPGFGVGFGVSFEYLPAVAAEFARRYQDFRIHEEAYATLYQQCEYAKVLEARDTPALTVLDYANPPERRSFPSRFRIVLAVFLFSLAIGCAFAFGAEYFDDLRLSKPDEHRAWVQLLGAFRRAGARLPWRTRDRDAVDAP